VKINRVKDLQAALRPAFVAIVFFSWLLKTFCSLLKFFLVLFSSLFNLSFGVCFINFKKRTDTIVISSVFAKELGAMATTSVMTENN
jgi:hypothetical protein